MNKYREIQSAYEKSREEYWHYRDDCIGFAVKLIFQVIDVLEVPKDRFAFTPLNEKHKENTKYTIWGATYLNDDSWWHTGIRLTIPYKTATFPYDVVLIPILHKKIEDTFHFKIQNQSRTFQVGHSDDFEKEVKHFCDFISETLIREYKDSFRQFIESKTVKGQFGFKNEPDPHFAEKAME